MERLKNRGLKRLLFFVIFLIPVLWYLILQLFGNNSFALTRVGDLDPACSDPVEAITVVSKMDTLTVAQTNYLNRVTYGVGKRSAEFVEKPADFFDCINQSAADLVLLKGSDLWGYYTLSRDGVDQLLTELDILVLQDSYGKGTSR